MEKSLIVEVSKGLAQLSVATADCVVEIRKALEDLSERIDKLEQTNNIGYPLPRDLN